MSMAILSGDPDQTGSPFVIRFRAAREIEVSPHWHPADEHITVIQGVYRLGYGDSYDPAALEEFPAGSYIQVRKLMHHFAWYSNGTIVQVNGVGPFRTFYV